MLQPVNGVRTRNGGHAGAGPNGASDADGRAGYLLSIIVPTRNEAGNVERLVELLAKATEGIATEVIFVDDSDDETPAVIGRLRSEDDRIRLKHRKPEERAGGLGSAVVEGLRLARAPWVCVMDGDLQHPADLVPRMFAKAQETDATLVVASRYADQGTRAGLGRLREAISRSLITAARVFFPSRLRSVTDPLSGFFLVRKDALDIEALRPRGFKILLEILVRTAGLRVTEVPFEFGERHAGESKASMREGLTYFSHLWHLRFGQTSSQFTRFAVVGASGIGVNQGLLALGTDGFGLHYLASAVLATQASSLWNFALTEKWVFQGRNQDHGALRRCLLFLGLNNAALTLRGPMLLVLTSGIGIHYLVSNLISLGALTAVRFAIADSWIWSRARGRSKAPPAHNYDIHGIVSVVSDVRLPELERFRIAETPAQPTISVRIGPVGMGQNRRNGHNGGAAHRHLRYEEGLGSFGFGMEIDLGETVEVVASPLLRHSPHVLYTNVVEPILRWTFVERGYALVHGACIAFGDGAFLVTAKTDTGKTTTVLRVLDRYPYSFVSDDLTLITAEGRILMYPKPLTVSRHTVAAVNTPLLSRWQRLALFVQSRVHSRSGRIFAHIIAKTRLPAATINTIVQYLIPPPKYQIDRLVPGVSLARESQLAAMFVIERGGDGQRSLGADEALEVLMANCEDAYGFPPYHEIEGVLHSSGERDLKAQERAIVASALGSVPSMSLASTKMDWGQRLPALLNGGAVAPVEPEKRIDRRPPSPPSLRAVPQRETVRD